MNKEAMSEGSQERIVAGSFAVMHGQTESFFLIRVYLCLPVVNLFES